MTVFGEKRKAVPVFYKSDKTKDKNKRKYEGCSNTLQVFKIDMRLAETVLCPLDGNEFLYSIDCVG